MKIAHFSPLPPQPSGIANYCSELIPYLAQHMEVDAFSSVGLDELNSLPFNVRPIREFWQNSKARYQYDLCLYHMGNHAAYHESVYTTMLRYPGITVLHELNLHAFFLQRTDHRDAHSPFVREMGYAYGATGVSEAMRLLTHREVPQVTQRPLFQRIANSSVGLIVHTEQARRLLLAASPRAAVARVPLAVSLPDTGSRPQRPDQLASMPRDVILLASFGYVAQSKRIEVILRALAQLRGTVPDFRYLMIGQPVSGYNPWPLVNELGLDDIVHGTNFVKDRVFQALISWIDIGLNLRTGPTGGEMSGTLVKLLAHGRPVLVSAVGGFLELPDDVVFKINQDESEIAQLVTVLRRLITDADARSACGRSASEYVATHFSFAAVARQYASFLQDRLTSLSSSY